VTAGAVLAVDAAVAVDAVVAVDAAVAAGAAVAADAERVKKSPLSTIAQSALISSRARTGRGRRLVRG